MRTDTKEKNSESVSRQLEFKKTVYNDAEDLLTEENRVLGKTTRHTKKFLTQFLPELVENGIQFRNGEIFTPSHLRSKFMRDDEWVRLRSEAKQALKALRSHEQKIAESE